MRVVEGPTECTKEVKCDGCTATLEIGMDDVLEGEFGGAYCEPGDLYVYVICCVCESHIKLGLSHQMPVLVRKRAISNKAAKNAKR